LKTKDWLAFIGLSLAWGSSFFWIKIALEEIGPFTLVALRILFGIIGLSAYFIYIRPELPREKRVWLSLAVLGVTNVALPFILITWSELHIDSAVASILNSSVPLFTTIIAHLFLKDDRLTKLRAVGLVFGFMGVLVLMGRDIGDQGKNNILAHFTMMLAAITYAFSAVIARRTTQGVPSVVISLAPLIVADVIIWSAIPFAETSFHLPQLAMTWAAVAWLGLIGSALAYIFYFYLLHSIGPTRATMVTFTFPVVGVLLGVLFLKETLDWNLAIGGGLVLSSIAVVNSKG